MVCADLTPIHAAKVHVNPAVVESTQLRSLRNLTLQLLHRDSVAPFDAPTSYREVIQAAAKATPSNKVVAA